jgi:hypothetical protein
LKKFVILIVFIASYFHSIQLTIAAVQLKTEDVASIQINSLSGGKRVFNENNGYEELVVRKVVEMINIATPVKDVSEIANNKPPVILLKINMKNGRVISIAPAYTCLVQNKVNTCTMADDEVVFTQNNQKERLAPGWLEI